MSENIITVKVENVISSIEPKRPSFDKLWNEYKKVMTLMSDAANILINDESRPLPSIEEAEHEPVHAIYNKIGGEIAKLHNSEDIYNNTHLKMHSGYQNSCALRLSEALNQSGFIIKGGTINPNKNILRNSGKTYSSSSGKEYHYRYIMQVTGIKTYLETRWGKPEITYITEPCTNSEECFKLHSKKFIGKKGIIAFDVEGWNDASGHVTVWDGSKCGDGSCFGGSHHYFDFKQVKKIYLWELK